MMRRTDAPGIGVLPGEDPEAIPEKGPGRGPGTPKGGHPKVTALDPA